MSKKEMEKGALGLRSPSYYAKCMFGGILACGFTHASVVTLDVAKCRTQAHSKSGRWPNGLVASIRKGYQLEGITALKVGWVPTFYGYGAQGLFKFGLNEVFKDLYTEVIGEDRVKSSKAVKMTLWAAASGSAEFFADIALCPFEMTKVKMQVTLPGDSGGISKNLIAGMRDMSARSADTKFPFGSLAPLWMRQIPYTMIKFVGFYTTAEWVYKQIEKQKGWTQNDLSGSTKLGITFACGYWAGIFCAIATQPFDNLVSMMGNPDNKGKSMGQMSREMGTLNLFTKGLGTRIIMIGTLTGLQWWIYGTTKYYMGFGTQ